MRFRGRVPPIVTWLAVLALLIIPAVVVAAETALHFSGSAIDGPFQLYNALRRIAAGQRPGVDFQFFHGMGVPYAHYWLFRALGGQFKDAEMAREMIAVIAFPASLLVFFRAFDRTWTRAVILAAGAIATVYALKISALLFALNSMVGLRSTLPAMIPIVLYRAERRPARLFGAGGLLGIALFVSTEQGLAAAGAFVVMSALAILRGADKRRETIDAAGTLGVAVATLIIALASVGGLQGAAGALHYNFALVPKDQYWFFGAPPNPFISSWSAAVSMLIGAPMIGLAMLFGVLAMIYYARRFWRAPLGEPERREKALAFFATYGVLSCVSLLGVFVPVYAQTCWRVLISLGMLEVLAWADRREPMGELSGGVPRVARISTLAMVAWVLVTSRAFRSTIFNSVPHFFGEHVAGDRGFEIAGIWPQTLAIDDQVLRAHRTAAGAPPKIWSTYAGWLEARAGVFNPSFDYVIHPLGPENRRAYLERFRDMRPELVQTVRPAYSQYELWIENANWDTYRELLRFYTISQPTPWSFLWERRTDSSAAPQLIASGPVPAGARQIQLPVVPTVGGLPVTVLDVELDYRTDNPLQWLPVVGPMPRYLVAVQGATTPMPISLDPYLTSSRFPVFAKPGQTPVLYVQPFSLLPGVGITVRSVRVSVVPVDPRNVAWLQELSARYGF